MFRCLFALLLSHDLLHPAVSPVPWRSIKVFLTMKQLRSSFAFRHWLPHKPRIGKARVPADWFDEHNAHHCSLQQRSYPHPKMPSHPETSPCEPYEYTAITDPGTIRLIQPSFNAASSTSDSMTTETASLATIWLSHMYGGMPQTYAR